MMKLSSMMMCCLCLKDSENITKIFEDSEAQDHNIAKVVAKHFWFEPLKEDPAFTAICKICWAKVYDFHEFYEMVEVVHQRYHKPEIVTVKSETAVVECISSLPNKNEPNDFDELDEVPFSSELISISKVLSVNQSGPMSLVSFDEPNNTHNVDDNSCDMDEYDNFHEDESEHSEDPFDDTGTNADEIPIKDILSAGNAKNDEETKLKPNARRSQRIGNSLDNLEASQIVKRGRKRKDASGTVVKTKEAKPRKQRSKDKANKKSEEESAYKIKMKSFDSEISQYMGLHCDVCNVSVENFADVKIHMRTEHKIDNGYVKCCDKKFHKRANLLHHIRHHVNPNCYRCEECDQTFSDYQSLRNHNFIKHQKEEDKIYECNECPKKFARKYLLEQHRTFKHKDRFKQCKTCNRRYKTLEELAEHNKEPCEGGRMCDICAKVIFGPSAFVRHQLEHDGQASKVQCDLCGSWHKDKYALRKHKRRHMQPKTPHVCDICNKVSPSRDAMESHKKYAHHSERSFECEFCKKSFKRPRSLREHMSTHTGASLYTCPHCPKTFNSNANMHSHRKNVHPVEFEEARKRRQRVGYLGDQLATISEALKPKLVTDKTGNDTSNPSQTKTDTSDTHMLYNMN